MLSCGYVPPIRNISRKHLKALIRENTVAKKKLYHIWGNVIYLSLWNLEAPSIEAASYSSSGIVVSPESNRITAYPVFFQRNNKTTTINAHSEFSQSATGKPNAYRPSLTNPVAAKRWSIIKTVPTTGITYGSRMTDFSH